MLLATASFLIGVKLGRTTALGGGNAPGVVENIATSEQSPKRDEDKRSGIVLFGKYRGLTYAELVREAPPSYLKWAKDTARSHHYTCRGLADLNEYLVSTSDPPVEVLMPSRINGRPADGGNASARTRQGFTYI